jgi:hypothetical protein
MANLVSAELRTAILASYFSGGAAPTNLYLRLYKDEASIVEATTLTDISTLEQTGGGYAVKTIAPADWTVEQGIGGIRVRLTDQTWTTSIDNWNTLRWGVLSTTAGNTGIILMARDYGTGKTVTGVGANVTIDDLFYQIND